MQPEILSFFAKYVERELGIIYAEHNFFQLQTRLEEIASMQKLAGVEGLYEVVKAGCVAPSLRQVILDIATNNETSFFRDPRVFSAIESVVVPDIVKKIPAGEKMRIWSAASSYGQEAFSTAILIREMMRNSAASLPDYEISATDISARVLDRAKTGRYSQLEVGRGLTPDLLSRYFRQEDENFWTVSSELQSRVSFRQQNLKEPFATAQKFHLILCRNVLIYQRVESKIEILNRLNACLHPEGYLILGAGENLIGLSDAFELVPADGCVLYRPQARAAA